MSRALDTLFADLPSRLSVDQLTEVLGLSDKTVTYRWLRDGRIPAIRLGGTWVIFRDDIKEHLEANYNTKPEVAGTSPSSVDEGDTEETDEGVADEDQEVISEPVSEDQGQPTDSTRGATSRREELQRIRDWAKDNGYTLSSRGRIPHTIVNAYNEAHT